MRTRAIWREAWANIRSGTTRAVMFSLFVSAAMLILIAADLTQVHRTTQAAESYQSAGASIVVLAAPESIDPHACEALNEVSGIRAAGSIRGSSDRLTFSTLPAAPIPIFEVTPNFSHVLITEGEIGLGLVFSDQAAEDLNLHAGDEVATTNGDVGVAGVYPYPSDGRTSGLGFAVLAPTNTEDPFDECWVDIWPQSEEIRGLLYMVVLQSDGPQNVSISQLNSSLGARFTGPHDYAERLTRFIPFVAAVVGILAGYLAIRLRRLEISSNLHAGVSRRDQRSILAIETTFWLFVVGTLSMTATSIGIMALTGADHTTYFILAARPLFGGIVGGVIGAGLAWLFTREKHFLRYFKNR